MFMKGKLMNVRKLFLSALVVYISGCAYYFPPLHAERIEQYKKTCESIGFKPQSSEHANCVLDLEKSYLQGKANKQSSGSSSGMSFLCKDAISRGDSGAINVHCN